MSNKKWPLVLGLIFFALVCLEQWGRAQDAGDEGSADEAPATEVFDTANSSDSSSDGSASGRGRTGPVEDVKEAEVEGSIANTNISKILETREILKPTYGFEDMFLTKGSSGILDVNNLPGYNRRDLMFFYTTEGVIVGSRKDASGAERIVAGNSQASTQILVYSKKMDSEGKAVSGERGDLLKVYRVTVTSDDLITLLQEMKALIGDVEGLEMRIVGGQVVVDGAVLVPKDMRRVLAVTGKYIAEKRPIINLAEISPVTMQLLGEKMEEEIAGGKDRPRDIRVKPVNGRFFLEGAVDTSFQRGEAEKICQAFISERYALEPKDSSGKFEVPKYSGLGECVSMIRVRAGQPAEPDPILAVRIDFVTLNRNYLKNFDFRWAPGISTNGSAQYSSDLGKFLTSFTATVGNLFPKLDTSARHGYARILKSATLLVRDGERSGGNGAPPEATINENLQIYALTPGTATTPATYQPVNVNTKVSIKAKSVSGTDKINMDILAVQSELKDAGTPGGAGPTVYSSEVKTSIVVSNNESAALGGLITERRNVGVTRDPATESDPNTGRPYEFNLFELGRQHSFTDDKSQFIIFVTPAKLRNPTEGTETLKRKFRLRK